MIALGAAFARPIIDAVQGEESSEWFNLELKPSLKKMCDTYKRLPPEKRELFIEKFTEVINEKTEPGDFSRSAMNAFRDGLVQNFE